MDQSRYRVLPRVHGLPLDAPYTIDFVQHWPLHNHDSRYQNNDYEMAEPPAVGSPRRKIERDLHGTLPLRQRRPLSPNIPPSAQRMPCMSYARRGALDGRSATTPRSFLNGEDEYCIQPYEHCSRTSPAPPSLNDRIESQSESEDDDCSSSSPLETESPLSPRSTRRGTRASSDDGSSTTSRQRTSNDYLSESQDRHLAAAWQELYYERREFEEEKAAFRDAKRRFEKMHGRDINDQTCEDTTCSDDDSEAEAMERVKTKEDEEA